MGKRFIINVLIVIGISFFVNNTKKACSQTLNLNQFGIEEGLPQSGIQSLTQDHDGNIWISTLAGVSKFNGLNFENFDKKSGLAENRVVSSLTDRNGNIWFGHWAGGISFYSRELRAFEEIVPKNISELLKTINVIFEDSKGGIWFGTNGQGLLKYTPPDQKYIEVSSISAKGKFEIYNSGNGLTGNRITAIEEDDIGNLWIGTENGISILSKKNLEFSVFSNLGIPQTEISALLFDKSKNLWIGTTSQGLIKYNIVTKVVKFYDEKTGLNSVNIKVVYEDNIGNIYIGTFGAGVFKYLSTLEANKYKGPIFQVVSTAQGLSNDKVLSIIHDREGNLWIGTYLNLNQYYDEQFEIYGKQEGLINSLVWSVIQDKKGDYWLGTEGGLFKFIQGQNRNENNFINYSNITKGQIANTTALYEDIEGYIWFTNFGNGVSRLNPSTKQIQVFNTSNGLTSNEVYCITGDSEGNVWIGTKRGASKYTITSKHFEHFDISNGLGGNQIYTIFNDSKNVLWFGVLGGPLTSFDGKVFKKYDEKDGYDNKFTLCITEDLNGNIWMGSYEKGIFKYDGKVFKNYGVKDGATSDNAFLLVSDKNNNLWVGTRLGIDKFNINSEIFKHYGKQDGFLGIEINPNAVCKDKNGNLLFGTIIGLVKYYAENERLNIFEPITYLQAPRINYKKVIVPESHEFSYFDNHFTFDFVGASLTNPQRVKYKFILDGYDKEWSPETKDNFATYSNLPPGKYIFKVISCNNDNIWNKIPEQFSFTILPPFWRTSWFYSFIILLTLVGSVSFVKIREKKLIQENRLLESKVNDRTLELRKEKEHVEFQNIEIENHRSELQKKNEHITDSIDYAKRIQEAVFVPWNLFENKFPNSFVFFKPKDIVSGDFYWMYPYGNKVLFAAADCTGHGVPGAFMSIIGYNLLNSIVKEQALLNPSKILSELNKQIALTLNQDENSRVKDGMDISLCSYDFEKKELEFAGANNPLYLIRNNELTEIKADKVSLGKSPLHTELEFTNHVLKINNEDVIFMFSDGFADQIGGLNRKKFYYPPFRALLLENHKSSFENQKEILEQTFIDWKGDRDQIDDILVIGIKF